MSVFTEAEGPAVMSDADFVDLAGVASLLNVSYSTVRTYRVKGQLPPADRMYGRTPVWRPETIRTWAATRPGQGVGGGRPPKHRRPTGEG